MGLAILLARPRGVDPLGDPPGRRHAPAPGVRTALTPALWSALVRPRQYARMAGEWAEAVGLARSAYGTHSPRRTKVALIYKRTGNLRAVQMLLGHTKLESTGRYLGVDAEDALTLSEATEVWSPQWEKTDQLPDGMRRYGHRRRAPGFLMADDAHPACVDRDVQVAANGDQAAPPWAHLERGGQPAPAHSLRERVAVHLRPGAAIG